jgi:hypothetical protein
VLASVAVSATDGELVETDGDPDAAADDPDDDVAPFEPHAASVTTNVAAQAANAMEAGTRVVFTAATLQRSSGGQSAT